MGFLDVLGNAGVALSSMNRTQADLQNERLQQEMRRLALEEGTMGMERAREARDLEKALRGVAPTVIPGTPEAPIYDEGDGQTQIGAIPGTPERQLPDYEGRARAALKAGRPDQWAKEMASAKAVQNEGIVDLAKALLSGQDPAAAVNEHYNRKGIDRIDPTSVAFENGVLTGKRANGQAFRLDPKAALIQAGVKTPKTVILKPGDKAVDEATGSTVAEGNAKPETKRNIDPLSPEGLEARKKLEDYKASLKRSGAANAPAKVREIEWLAKQFGGDIDRAIALAYGTDKGAKTEEERVLRWANVLKSDVGMGIADSNALLARARELAKTFSDAGADRQNRRPSAAAPSAAGKPAPGGLPKPQSQEEFDALPSGAKFINPADGRTYIKK